MASKGFSIIVACDDNRGIGLENTIPWHLAPDLKYFRDITMGRSKTSINSVIMGFNTWTSINCKPLLKRKNIILTRTVENVSPYPDISFCNSLDSALNEAMYDSAEVFVIGGESVYDEALFHPLLRKVYLTHIMQNSLACDRFFGKNISMESLGLHLQHQSDVHLADGIKYQFLTYVKS